MRCCKSLLYAFLLLLLAAMPAAATVLTWDATTGNSTVEDGSGTWNTGGGNNWWNGSANQAWADGDSAVIGALGPASGPVGTITVSGTMNLSGLKLDPINPAAEGTYEITGGTLSFSSGATITVNQPRDQTATIPAYPLYYTRVNSAIAGANLSFSSDIISPADANKVGILQLGGTNTNTGTLTVNSNTTLWLTEANSLSAGVTGIVINQGATLDMSYAGTISVPITLNSLGAVNAAGTSGLPATYLAPAPGNAGGLRLGENLGGTTDLTSTITFTGDSEMRATATSAGINNVNINTPLASNYHVLLRTVQRTTLTVNNPITALNLGLQVGYSSPDGSSMTLNSTVSANDLFVAMHNSTLLTINQPVTLTTTAGLGRMSVQNATTSLGATGVMKINATITAPGGIEFQRGLVNTASTPSGVELNSASGFAFNTPEILFTSVGGTGNTLVVTKADDQISHNAVLTFKDSGNTRTFKLDGHTATVAGIQTTGTFNTATQAVIEKTLTGATGTLTVDNTLDYSFGGRIRDGLGLFALVKKGVGKLSLTGDRIDDYTGGTTVEDGTLDLSNATINATGYKLTLSGGTVDFGPTTMGLFAITGGTAMSTYFSTVTSNVNYAVQGGNVAVALAGTTGLNKTGSGIATLSAFNSYTGKTTIGEGTLKLTGSGKIDYSTVVELQNGATLDVSEIPGYTSGMQTIQGNGTISGNLTTAFGATLAPGVLKNAQKLTFANGLTLANGANLNFDLASTVAGVSDKINVNGNLSLGDFSTFNVNVGVLGSSVQFNTPYTVLTYTGSLSGSAYSFSTATNTTRLIYTTALDTTGKKLTVTATGGAPKSLAWAGTALAPNWDLKTTNNWLDGVTPEMFYDLDTVNFGDGHWGTVNLLGTLRPGAINVNASQDYEFTGSGISGDPTFAKSGSGTLTLSNANDFTSDLTVNGGTLKINNAAALGTTDGKTRLSGTGVLDVAGFKVGDEEIVVESGGNVKITNSVDNLTVTQDAIRFLTLNGDVIFGGGPATTGTYEYRWDLRNRINPGVGIYLVGNGHKITKVDSNRVDIVDMGETDLGDVEIQQGQLSFVRTTTMGRSTGTVSVAGGALVRIYGSSQTYDKKVTLADTAELELDHASNATISGLVKLTGGTVAIDLAGETPASPSNLKLSGDVTGPGGLTLTGPATSKLTLDGAKSYTGNTLISSATLSLTGSGAMDSAVVTVNTALNVLDGAHTLKVIDGTGTVNVAAAASMTATSISTGTLTIGTAAAAATVPEPSTWLILLTAVMAVAGNRLYSRRKS